MGYATDQFYNAGSYMDPSELDVDQYSNPKFLWPGDTRKHSEPFNPNGTWVDKQEVRRGFIRMLSMTKGGTASETMAKRRCFFQFNPDKITRSVSMREDMMHPLLQSPSEFSLPVPGNSNFGFTLMFDRSFELNNGTQGRGIDDPSGSIVDENDLLLSGSPKTIGVLADMRILDGIVGQGISQDMIEYIIERGKIYQSYNTSDTPNTSGDTAETVGEQVVAWVDLMSGASGPIVTKVQQALVANDSTLTTTYTNFIDGQFGPNTTAAVKAYQTAKGLQSTGIVNSETAKSLGVENTETVNTPTAGASAGEWDEARIRTGLNMNIGNQAFMIPNPVRVVFSSLFMVDGFVTSMTVSHVRFNENMVPMTCYVDIQMQALYIGFARKDTFLTEALKQAEALQESTPSIDTPVNDVIVDKQSYDALKDLIFTQRALKDFKLVAYNAIDDVVGIFSSARSDWDDDSLWGWASSWLGTPYMDRSDLAALTQDDYINNSNGTMYQYTEQEWFFPGMFGEATIPFRMGFKQPKDTDDDAIFKAWSNDVAIKNISWSWELTITRPPLTPYERSIGGRTTLLYCTDSQSVNTSEEWRTIRRQQNIPINNDKFGGNGANGRCCMVLNDNQLVDIGLWRSNAETWMENANVFLLEFDMRGSITDTKGNIINFYGNKTFSQGVGNTIKFSVQPVNAAPAKTPTTGGARPGDTGTGTAPTT